MQIHVFCQKTRTAAVMLRNVSSNHSAIFHKHLSYCGSSHFIVKDGFTILLLCVRGEHHALLEKKWNFTIAAYCWKHCKCTEHAAGMSWLCLFRRRSWNSERRLAMYLDKEVVAWNKNVLGFLQLQGSTAVWKGEPLLPRGQAVEKPVTYGAFVGIVSLLSRGSRMSTVKKKLLLSISDVATVMQKNMCYPMKRCMESL